MPNFTLEELGYEEKAPTIGELATMPYSFDPTTSQVLESYAEEAWKGVGTLHFDLLASEAEKAKEQGTPLTEEEYQKHPLFRSDIPYDESLTESRLKILNDVKQEGAERDFIRSQGTAMQNILGFVGSIPAAMVEPRGLAEGLAIGAVTMGAGTAIRPVRALMSNWGTLRKSLTLGAVQGTIQSGIDAPINYYQAKKLHEKYGWEDILTDWTVGTALGATIDVGAFKIGQFREKRRERKREAYKNRLHKQISVGANKYGIDSDTAYAIVGIESNYNPDAINKDTKAFGLFQFVESTGKEYGVDANSSPEEQMDAFFRFTDDNINHIAKKIKRTPDPHEVYMGHLFGRYGAASMLTAKNKSQRFTDWARQNGFYKGKERLVMTQNGLPPDATVQEAINFAKDKMDHHIGHIGMENQKMISDADVDALDVSMEQVMEGRRVDTDPVYAQQMSVFLKDSEGFLKRFNEDYNRRREIVLAGAKSRTYDIEKVKEEVSEIMTASEVESEFRISQYESQQKAVIEGEKDVRDEFYNFRDDYRDQIEQKQGLYKKYFNQLEGLKAKQKETLREIETFDYDARVREAMGASKAKKAKARAEKKVTKQLQTLKRTAGNIDRQVEQITEGLGNAMQADQLQMAKKVTQSVEAMQDLLNDPIYDRKAMDDVKAIEEEIKAEPKDNVDTQIQEMESLLQKYDDSGLMGRQMKELFEQVKQLPTKDKIKQWYDISESCMITGGSA